MQPTIHGVAESQARLSDFTFHIYIYHPGPSDFFSLQGLWFEFRALGLLMARGGSGGR